VHDADRFRLLGTYTTPKVRRGRRVKCVLRGAVQVVGYTHARIPWPVGKAGGHKGIAVYGDLAQAVGRESAQAVAFWWGVTPLTVTAWRHALRVGPSTEGTRRLRSLHAQTPEVAAGRAKALALSRDPEADAPRRAKIAAAKTGKPRPPHVSEAVRRAHLGTKPSEETRARMSATHRARGTRPPNVGRAWTPEEDALLGTLPAAEAARRTGRTLPAVYDRRHDLRLPGGRRRK